MLELDLSLPRLPADRIVLRPLGPRDVPALFEIFADPEGMRYWSRPPLADMAAAERLLAEIDDCFRTRTLFQWGIARRVDDLVVGTCTLASLSAEHRRAEIGYALARTHWGQGYMAEALTALLRFALGPLGLHRIEADVHPDNAASIRALERLGFQREGYLRERYRVGSEVQDTVYFGLLRADVRFPLSDARGVDWSSATPVGATGPLLPTTTADYADSTD